MKKRFNIFLFAAIFLAGVTSLEAGFQIAPYYNYNFTEGMSVSPAGDMGFLVNLSNDIGLIVKPMKSQSLIGFYSLKYQGPGLKQQEGQEFSERYLDHLFVGRHHWTLPFGFTLKTQGDYLREARRSGTNETWENGLYNFNRYGGSSAVEKTFGPFALTGGVKYHYMDFPNYTDLLAELRSGADSSASEGQQNHHIYEVAAKAEYKTNKAELTLGQQIYTKQKVAANEVQSDGSFYLDTLQNDFNVSLRASRVQPILKFAAVEPGLEIGFKNSNQNYQHFETATSSVPVSFHADFNDYRVTTFSMPMSLFLTKKWSLLLSPSWSQKKYLSRSPQKANGTFDDTKLQERLLSIYTVGFKNQIGESSSSMLFLTYQTQTSNMEYEKYVAYNYSAYSVGLRFQMEY